MLCLWCGSPGEAKNLALQQIHGCSRQDRVDDRACVSKVQSRKCGTMNQPSPSTLLTNVHNTKKTVTPLWGTTAVTGSVWQTSVKCPQPFSGCCVTPAKRQWHGRGSSLDGQECWCCLRWEAHFPLHSPCWCPGSPAVHVEEEQLYPPGSPCNTMSPLHKL